ncbi:hypothetical protein C427_1563 [Paraglaciecola psychrophila 170]|uniref:Uncharacterized protein n=1 Tax=Paraglaciecola psychrophila 170 TaxID=1129794 RepID=M4RYY1_9ALTE|nr:hypothetical protein C427_1563 [Paraglaciecola psychrophila 170]
MRTAFKPCLLAASITLAVLSSQCVMANENINLKNSLYYQRSIRCLNNIT